MSRGSTWSAFVAVLVAVVLATTGGAAAAPAPTTVAESFVQALVNGDAAACSYATERLQRLLARLGGQRECAAALRSGAAAAAGDKSAKVELGAAYGAAQIVVRDHVRELGSDRHWTNARFDLAGLARDLRDYQIDARVGGGPAAARNTPSGRVVIDRVRSTRTTLVLYAESDSGTIWRLTGTTKRRGPTTRTTTRGVPGSGVVPRALAYPAVAGAAPRVAVFTELGGVPDFAFLLTLTPALRVDAVYVGAIAKPLAVGVGPRDRAEFADRLQASWSARNAKALCADIDPRLLATAAFKTLFGTGCNVALDATGVRQVVQPGLDGWSADGTADVALEVQADGEKFTFHHLVTPGPATHRVTGLLFDFDEIAELLLRPI